MMRENRLLRKNKKISHFIVGEIVSTIKGKKLIKSYLTREKGGFRLNHFEYEGPLSEKIRNRKARAELNLKKKKVTKNYGKEIVLKNHSKKAEKRGA
jgi:hypothetical protein